MMRVFHYIVFGWVAACSAGTPKGEDTAESFAVRSDIIGIVVVPAEIIVPEGSEVRLQALALNDERESYEITDAVEWMSSSSSVAEISNALEREGTVTGTTSGVTSIHAEFEGIESSPAWVTVTDAELLRLGIAPSSVIVGVGDTVQLSAEATFADGRSSDASSQVRWITDDGSVATMDDDGLLTGVALGDTTIVVEWNGVASDPIPVTVSDDAGEGSVDLTIDSLLGHIHDGYLEISIDIRNAGEGVAEAFWVDLFVDPIVTPTYGDLPDTYYLVDYLGPGESTNVTFVTGTPDSYHSFAVLLDSMEEQAESNESNNFGAGDTMGESSVGGSDGGTTASDGLANLEFVYVGGFSSETTTEYWVDVKNSGTSPSSDFYVDVFFDGDFETMPELYDEGTVYEYQVGLAPEEVVYTTLEVPLACDSCGAWVVLDGFDFVEESDEDDNVAWYVQGQDWVLASPSLEPY